MSKSLWVYSAPLLDELFYLIIPLECCHPLFKSCDPCIHILKQHLLSTYSWVTLGYVLIVNSYSPFFFAGRTRILFMHQFPVWPEKTGSFHPHVSWASVGLSGICLSCFHLAVTDSVLAHTLLLLVSCKDQRNPKCPHIMELTCLDCLCLGFLWKIQSAY